jgi:hypothetical protein
MRDAGKITMDNTRNDTELMGGRTTLSGQWQTLKERAQNESEPEALIAIIEEIDDLLFMLEKICRA